ncbi:MAG: thioredoxin [Holosporales bacterium]|jgi:thioredoxin 1|nr:thioredoxin [Holosporales bacterium]
MTSAMITDVVHVNDFEDRIQTGIHLVDFWALWCGPCRILSSILEEISDKISIIKINVEEAEELASRFDIQSIPTMILFKDGEIVDSKGGFMSNSALIKWLKEYGVDVC